MNRVLQKIDAAIYGIIGPLAILYILPRYFLQLETDLGIALPQLPALKYLGVILMNAGGLIAVWCGVLMFRHGRGSVSPLSPPRALLTSGPYRYVRHPMMWTVNLVLLGEALLYTSPLLMLWLAIWMRFAVVYIARYEEPYLESVFGDAYREYCRHTPRWLPHQCAAPVRQGAARGDR